MDNIILILYIPVVPGYEMDIMLCEVNSFNQLANSVAKRAQVYRDGNK